MWIVVAIAGLALELTAIVLLGRSVTRRDEVDQDARARPATVDEARATIVARGYVGRAEELSRAGLRMRLEWPAHADPSVLGPVPEPRSGD